LVQMAPHLGDESRLIALSKAGRQQFESLLAQERDLADKQRGGWHPANEEPPAT